MGTSAAIRERKSSLRQRLAEERRSLPLEVRKGWSLSIQKSCRDLPVFREAPVVSSFIGYGEEVETEALVRTLMRQGRRLAVPTRRMPGGEPSFAEIVSWEELSPNSLGILEPRREFLRPIAPSAIGLFLVPGLGFDRNGGRLGYGLGFYDRALAGASAEALLAGLCFDFQIVEKVPVADHDLPMDLIISEKRIIAASPRVKHMEEVF